jgi:hypothetical protein
MALKAACALVAFVSRTKHVMLFRDVVPLMYNVVAECADPAVGENTAAALGLECFVDLALSPAPVLKGQVGSLARFALAIGRNSRVDIMLRDAALQVVVVLVEAKPRTMVRAAGGAQSPGSPGLSGPPGSPGSGTCCCLFCLLFARVVVWRVVVCCFVFVVAACLVLVLLLVFFASLRVAGHCCLVAAWLLRGCCVVAAWLLRGCCCFCGLAYCWLAACCWLLAAAGWLAAVGWFAAAGCRLLAGACCSLLLAAGCWLKAEG